MILTPRFVFWFGLSPDLFSVFSRLVYLQYQRDTWFDSTIPERHRCQDQQPNLKGWCQDQNYHGSSWCSVRFFFFFRKQPPSWIWVFMGLCFGLVFDEHRTGTRGFWSLWGCEGLVFDEL